MKLEDLIAEMAVDFSETEYCPRMTEEEKAVFVYGMGRFLALFIDRYETNYITGENITKDEL